ncbi:MAG: hypothetical protein ACLP1Y_15845 [Candidatus Acidiferrales bacterium]
MNSARNLAAVLILTVVVSGVARAQQPAGTPGPSTPDQPVQPSSNTTKDEPPVPVVHSIWGIDSPAPTADPNAYIPDSRPLSGSSVLTAGQPQSHVNIFDVSLNFAFAGGNGLISSGGQSVFGTQSVVGGDLNYDHTWRQNSFAASYDGGGSFYDPSSSVYGNGMFHSLSLGEQLVGGRWKLRLTDDVLYGTNADVGGAGMAGPGLLGSFGGPFAGLAPDFGGAGETIITGQGRRLNDSSVADVEYDLTPRSAITVTGSYDILHFLDAGFIDSRNYLGRVGYDLGVSAKSTVAFYFQMGRSYYGLFSTGDTGPGGSGTPPVLSNMTEYGGGIAFSHRLTGRMAFQIAGGPDLEKLPPASGSSSPNRWVWDVNTSVSYEFRRSSLSLSYFHGPMQGSGVYSGSSSHVFNANYSRRLTRFFSTNLYGGYTRNSALASAVGFSNQFSNWYAGANVSRQLGRWMNLFIYYGAQEQTSSGACPVASCALAGTRQTFGVSLAWHPRPIVAE